MSIFDIPGILDKVPVPRTDLIHFQGGLDTETTTWNVEPGKIRSSQNYEHGIEDGYLDIKGYERFSGKPKPSGAAYSILNVDITGEFSIGDTVTQLVSGATGVIITVVTTTTPSYLVLTKITGTFDATNDLQVSAVTEGTALSLAVPSGASSSNLNGQYNNLAADEYRSDIAVVPGSGDVTGVTRLNDIKYAFRNNAGGTETDIYKSTSSGWVQVPLGRELSFTSGGGAYTPVDGDTITGAISGATAVLTRVVVESGDIGAPGTASGRFIFASQTGTFQSENLDIGANLNVATIAGDSTAITLLPDGRYKFDIAQFGGEAGTSRIYGCDSVNRGFEFNGTTYVPINTTMTTDTPSHVIIHKNHLFFSFDGSAQHSGINTPYIWSPVFGAAELATGDTISGFMSEPGSETGGALGIYNRNTIHMLYGTSSADWNLVRYRDEVGAFAHTLQQIGQTIFQDDRGITNFYTVQAHGNFQHATISRDIQSLFNQKKTLANASCVVRDKNQYRIFYTDKTAFYITMDKRGIKGIMPITLEHKVTSIFSLEDNDGNEEIFFGSDNGFVYQMEKGTSFDGEPIEAFMFLHYVFNGYVRNIKKYLGITIEAEGDGYAEFNLGYELGYGSTDLAQPGLENQIINFSNNRWDLFTWDAFTWDGQTLAPSASKLHGSAVNLAIIVIKNSDYFVPVKMSGAQIRFTLRRLLRN